MDIWKKANGVSASDEEILSYMKQLEEMVEELESANKEQAKHIALLEERLGESAKETQAEKSRAERLSLLLEQEREARSLAVAERDEQQLMSASDLSAEREAKEAARKELQETLEEQEALRDAAEMMARERDEVVEESRTLCTRLEEAEQTVENLRQENEDLRAELEGARRSKETYWNHSITLHKEKTRLEEQLSLLNKVTQSMSSTPGSRPKFSRQNSFTSQAAVVGSASKSFKSPTKKLHQQQQLLQAMPAPAGSQSARRGSLFEIEGQAGGGGGGSAVLPSFSAAERSPVVLENRFAVESRRIAVESEPRLGASSIVGSGGFGSKRAATTMQQTARGTMEKLNYEEGLVIHDSDDHLHEDDRSGRGSNAVSPLACGAKGRGFGGFRSDSIVSEDGLSDFEAKEATGKEVGNEIVAAKDGGGGMGGGSGTPSESSFGGGGGGLRSPREGLVSSSSTSNVPSLVSGVDSSDAMSVASSSSTKSGSQKEGGSEDAKDGKDLGPVEEEKEQKQQGGEVRMRLVRTMSGEKTGPSESRIRRAWENHAANGSMMNERNSEKKREEDVGGPMRKPAVASERGRRASVGGSPLHATSLGKATKGRGWK